MASASTPSGCEGLVSDLAQVQEQVTAQRLADLAFHRLPPVSHLCLILLSPSSSGHFGNLKKPWSLPCMTTKRMIRRNSRYSAMKSTTCSTALRFTGGGFRTGTGKAPGRLLSQLLRGGGNKDCPASLRETMALSQERGAEAEGGGREKLLKRVFSFSEGPGRHSLTILTPWTLSSQVPTSKLI